VSGTTRPRFRSSVAALGILLLVPLAGGPAQASPEPVPETAPPALDATERLETLPDTPEEVPPADVDGTVGAVVETDDGLEVITVDAEPDELDEVEADLEQEPDVVDVVDVFVDVPVHATASVNDFFRSDQWGLDALSYNLIPTDVPDGSDQIVAVVDTGVRALHPDLVGRVDCTLGADFTQSSETSSGQGCTDPNGHGTHVAGVVSALSNNGIGVAGLSAATIMPVRVLDAQGAGSAAGIIAGIIWAVDHEADVINLSLSGEQSSAFDAAIQYALDNDVVVIAAAGNNREEGNLPQSPSSNDGVIAVAASDELGLSAPYSYSGPTNLISAPGDYILSTVPSGTGYEFASGTSMAAPHVAGIVARYRAIHPEAHVEDIRTAIQSTAVDLEEPGFDENTGYGLIDMRELLTGADAPADVWRGAVPAAPRITALTPGNSSMHLEWEAPSWTGRSGIAEYEIDVFGFYQDRFWLVDTRYASAATRELTIGGVSNGAPHLVLMRARNFTNGWGQWSLTSELVTPRTTPGAPKIGTPTAGPAAARVRWSQGATGGAPITSYVVRAYRGWDVVAEVTVPGTARDVRIGGLTNGRAHTFLVRAVNEAGTGPWSTRSIAVTPVDTPGAPTIGKPTAANDAARVYWKPPTDNGGAYVSGYVVRAWQGTKLIKSVTASGTATNVLVSGLANKGYYAFTVTAKNVAGLGTPSARSATVRTT
jgi:subtilisin family serine protease